MEIDNNESINKVKEATKVTFVGFIVNLFLTAGKITAGILGNSSAMLADGFHSLSDFVTDAVVIVFVRLSGKKSDANHTYGHGKYETFATLLISIALFAAGIGILVDSGSKIVETVNGTVLPEPKYIALWAALISLIAKEILFRYTIKVGKKINSKTVIANGWHHRSDAFSSIGAALGISGAIFLGESWRILDPIAGFIVSIFIIKVAFNLGIPCIRELLEHSLPQKEVARIEDIIRSNKEVISYHKLKTRRVGSDVAIDVHVLLKKDISFSHAHNITKEIEQSLYSEFGNGAHINLHAEPAERES